MLFGQLDGGVFGFDPYEWMCAARTIPYAHDYVADHWSKLKSGDVIDVEYTRGETDVEKTSERLGG